MKILSSHNNYSDSVRLLRRTKSTKGDFFPVFIPAESLICIHKWLTIASHWIHERASFAIIRYVLFIVDVLEKGAHMRDKKHARWKRFRWLSRTDGFWCSNGILLARRRCQVKREEEKKNIEEKLYPFSGKKKLFFILFHCERPRS